MKNARLLFASILGAICMLVQAQTQLEYRPFAEDGKTWSAQVGLIKENVYSNQIDGDTVINGEKWKKVYNSIFWKGPGGLDHSYYAAICDVGKKVYAIAKGSNKARLLYDFDLKVGDILRCGVEGNAFYCLLEKDEQPDTLLGFPFISYLRVERIDIIKARGMDHRRFTLSLLDAFKEHYRNGEESIIDNVVWVEGVGSGAGPFFPWMPLPPQETFLQSCEINTTCIFGYPDFYDADISNAVNCSQSSTKENTTIYDLSGRRATKNHGVYLRNGKKIIMK